MHWHGKQGPGRIIPECTGWFLGVWALWSLVHNWKLRESKQQMFALRLWSTSWIYIQISDYQQILLVKLGTPLTLWFQQHKATNWRETCVNLVDRWGSNVPHLGGWLWSEVACFKSHQCWLICVYGHGFIRITERCITKGVFGEWVWAVLL